MTRLLDQGIDQKGRTTMTKAPQRPDIEPVLKYGRVPAYITGLPEGAVQAPLAWYLEGVEWDGDGDPPWTARLEARATVLAQDWATKWMSDAYDVQLMAGSWATKDGGQVPSIWYRKHTITVMTDNGNTYSLVAPDRRTAEALVQLACDPSALYEFPRYDPTSGVQVYVHVPVRRVIEIRHVIETVPE